MINKWWTKPISEPLPCLLAKVVTVLLCVAIKGQAGAGMCERFHMSNNHIKDANVLCANVCYAHTNSSCCACQPVISRSMPPPLYFSHDKYHPKHTALSTLRQTLKPCFWLIKASLQLSKALQDFKQKVTLKKNSGIPIQTTQSESWNSQYLYMEKSCSCFMECQKSTKAKKKAEKQSNDEVLHFVISLMWKVWAERHCITSIKMWLFLSYIQDLFLEWDQSTANGCFFNFGYFYAWLVSILKQIKILKY